MNKQQKIFTEQCELMLIGLSLSGVVLYMLYIDFILGRGYIY